MEGGPSRTSQVNPTNEGEDISIIQQYRTEIYETLNWSNPLSTAVKFSSILGFLLVVRFFPVGRYLFHNCSSVLLVTIILRFALNTICPRETILKYHPNLVIVSESYKGFYTTIEKVIDFVLHELQVIFLVDDFKSSIAALFVFKIFHNITAWISLWGVLVIVVLLVFLGPLVYVKNQEVIDNFSSRLLVIIEQKLHDLKSGSFDERLPSAVVNSKLYDSITKYLPGEKQLTKMDDNPNIS